MVTKSQRSGMAGELVTALSVDVVVQTRDADTCASACASASV